MSNKLKEYREKQHLTQADLVLKAASRGERITLSAISKIERGLGNPRPRTRRILAEALGLSVEDVFPLVALLSSYAA